MKRDAFLDGWESGWRPDPRLTVSQWADKYRKLGSKSSAEPGDWRTDRAPYAREPMDSLSTADPTEVVVMMWGAQTGKALALDTPLPTPAGWTTMGDVCVGDTLFDQDGQPCRVVAKSPVFVGHKCFEVEFSDGTKIVADAGHRWETMSGHGRVRSVVTTQQIADTLMLRGNRFNHAVDVALPLQCESRKLPIDPYVLGVWLGDGNQAGNRRPMDPVRIARDSLEIRLRALGLHLEKRIPAEYLRASAFQRELLLRGLMDTDGTCCRRGGGMSFCTVSELLAGQVMELCRSIGLKPTLRRLTRVNAWTVNFMAYREDISVFDLRRKAALTRSISDPRARPTETKRRSIVAVREAPSVPVQCIAVDSPRHLFLAGRGMIPTHNTETGNNWLGYIMHHAPGPIMAVQPTVDMAKRLSKQRLADMIEQTPALRERVAEARSRDSGNTLLSKEFPGGVLVLTGANSASGLRSMPARYLFMDECDAFPLDVEEEGDPVSLAIKRTTTFGRRRKVLITSTPTVKDVSRIEREFERSDKRRFFVPCPHCGHRQWLRWRGYTDDQDDPRAKEYRLVWLDEARTEAGYRCGGDGCGAIIEEHHKTKMLLGGEWVPTAPGDGKTRGYQLSSLYSPLGWLSWVELLQEFEAAATDPTQLKTFINTRLAETWEDATTVRLDAEGLAARAGGYEQGTVPYGGLVITAGVDLQRDRAHLILRAWGAGDESWLVDRKVIYGDPQQPELWRQVLNALDQEYPHASGVMMRAYAAAVDSGDGETTQAVYAFARHNRARHVLAIKGQSTPGKVLLGKPTKQDVNIRKQTVKNGVDLWPVGSDTGKALIHGRLRMEATTGPGAIHWPMGLDPDYWKQLTSERQVTKLVNGFPKRVWVKKDNDRNEDLDCEVYAAAALEYVKTRHNRASFWDQMAARLEKTVEIRENQPENAETHVVDAASAGKISLSGWKRA